MDDSRSRVHRDHAAVSSQLTRLTESTGRRAGPLPPAARRAVLGFVSRWGRRLDAHFRAEERAARAGIRDGCPPELAGTDRVRHEREAVAAIVDLLRYRRAAFLRGDAAAVADVEAAVRDLADLWQRHVRRAAVRESLMGDAPRPRDAGRPRGTRRGRGGHRG